MTVTTAQAEMRELRQLNTGDDSRGWEAVGRIDFGRTGFCTGVLVAPDLVLTAGHCLFNKATGERFGASDIRFSAGLRNGRASAYRNVKYAVVHPKYRFAQNTKASQVRDDVALLQLAHPIRNTGVLPFETTDRPAPGARIAVVSYAHDRAEAPSLQEACEVIDRRRGVLVMSCAADFGASGAPVFSIEGGVPRIVALISAKAEAGGVPVSLGTSLKEPLALLKVELNAQSLFKQVGTDERPSGAKFLRP
ncbi:trypsin-like serine protease [Marinovum sp. 2_MG-2023]|nr:trypsin-like serine protease [Marinovum sp. 2_MG-2023]MDO6778737.1 trypsin-like serine protease [Marinovum sp. 1_MG-2023]